MKLLRQLFLFIAGVCVPLHTILAVVDDQAEFERLNEAVDRSEARLAALIEVAESKGLNTQFAFISAHTIEVFQQAAASDYANVDTVHEIFSMFHRIKEPRTGEEAQALPFNELRGCIDVATHAIEELESQLDGSIVLRRAPNLAKGEMVLGAGYYELDGRPVFPSSMVWLNTSEDFLQAYGRIGQGYYAVSQLAANGTVDSRALARATESAQRCSVENMAPCVFFLGHTPAKWMREQHPEILQGARNFTKYDIDSPLVQKWMTQVIEAIVPAMSEGFGEQPKLHLLANEPHFSTARGGWLARNGLSDYTIGKYHSWLETKYQEIAELNRVYGTEYERFDKVFFYDLKSSKNSVEPWRMRQIDKKRTRGGPVWYDWVRFNQYRVNQWFTFLKEQVQANDGQGAPVTIKMLGFSLSSNTRDGGMDIEYLTNLQDVMGADLRVSPRGAEFYGQHEDGMESDTGWQHYFAYDWVEQSMYLDFSKSLCPDKAFYDSEWHGFGAVSWRDFRLSRDYVRSALWMAFTDGMSLIKPWVWGRTDEMALTNRTDHIGELSTQPIAVDAYGRVMKELNAHADWLAPSIRQPREFLVFYCEESAIQDGAYTEGLKSVYEALRLLNVSTGFTTPTNLATLDPKSQTVLVSPTRYISDESLSALLRFKQIGGRLLFVGESFMSDEYGADRKPSGIEDGCRELPIGYTMDYVASFKEVVLPLASRPEVDVKFFDTSGMPAYGVMMKQLRHPATGEQLIVLNNLNKGTLSVELEPGNYLNMITGEQLDSHFEMKPCEVRVLRIVE